MTELKSPIDSLSVLKAPDRFPGSPTESAGPGAGAPAHSRTEAAVLGRRAWGPSPESDFLDPVLPTRFSGPGGTPAEDRVKPESAAPNGRPFTFPPESEIATVPPPQPAAAQPTTRVKSPTHDALPR